MEKILMRAKTLSWFILLIMCGAFGASEPGASKGVLLSGRESQISSGNHPTSGALSLYFEMNPGQADQAADFVGRGPDYTLLLTQDKALLRLYDSAPPKQFSRESPVMSKNQLAQGGEESLLSIKFLGRDSRADGPEGIEKLPSVSNYFIGNDPSRWRKGVRHYARVKYKGVYPGIDFVFYSNEEKQLEFDAVVSPGADYSRIRLRFDGVEDLYLDAQGNLIINTPYSRLVQQKPIVYQILHGKRKHIDADYVLTGKRVVAFRIARYDLSEPLIIDPVLIYSTYLGGTSIDNSFDVAIDDLGNAYVTGLTKSPNFPTKDPYQAARSGDFDAFLAKFDPRGTLIYSTYIGGRFHDCGTGVVVDSQGRPYLVGHTQSDNFPPMNAYQGQYKGQRDAFVVRFSASGSSLEYSTFIGGSKTEFAEGIAVDGTGSAYITGSTYSKNDFPIQNALQARLAGGIKSDAFVTKLGPGGNTLEYSTYLGGPGGPRFSFSDRGYGIAVDGTGSAYITGATHSTQFPTKNPYQSSKAGSSDAFVAKLSPSGAELLYSTYLGGTDADQGRSIAVDIHGSAYVTGYANSSDFPTSSAVQGTFGGWTDAFVTKLDPSGSSLHYSTYLGGTKDDIGYGIAVDARGSAYVAGRTPSADFPVHNAFQEILGGGSDAFVSRLSPRGNTLWYSSYLGGESHDEANAIAVDNGGTVYLTGRAGRQFSIKNAYQEAFGGFLDAFVAKIGQRAIYLRSGKASVPSR